MPTNGNAIHYVASSPIRTQEKAEGSRFSDSAALHLSFHGNADPSSTT